MPAPVTVTIDVPQPRPAVYEYLDVMANHERFTDHMLVDWTLSGPERGVGSMARVHNQAARGEVVDIKVIQAEAPRLIVERNVSAKGKRTAHGTYELEELPGGGTRISFTFSWVVAPLGDRILAPVIRKVLRSGNQKAMERLRDELKLIESPHAEPDLRPRL